MRRQYYAECDDGHDWSGFKFYSEHRANSRANLEDARRAGDLKYGKSWSKFHRIIKTWRDDSL